MRRIGLILTLLAAGGVWGESPLYWAIANNDALEVWKLTAPEGPPAVLEENGLPPPAWAVERASAEVLEVLAWRGVSLDQVDVHGRNLLYGAAALGRVDLFDRIAAAGALTTQVDDQGNTLVHAGATAPHLILVGRLLATGLDATARTNLGVTPLMRACGAGRSEAVTLLLRWGGVPEDLDFLGRSVRDYAVRSGDTATLSVIDQALSPWSIGQDGGDPLP
jgi:ankyrin repeat protein